MRTSKLARSALWLPILGCWVGIGFPAAAAPGPESRTAGNVAAAPKSANGVGSPFELAFWQSVSSSEDPHQLEAYLSQYPNGTFSGLARAKIAALDRRGAGGTVADKSLAATAVSAVATAAPSRPEPADDDSAGPTGLPVAAIPGPLVPPAAATAEAVKPSLAPAAPAAAPSSPAGQSSLPPSLADQLRALGQSQGRRPEAPPSAPVSQCVQTS